MKFLEGGKLVIDLYDVFDGLTAEQCEEVADAMSCAPAVIENVARQILDGCTEMGSYGSKGCGPTPSTPLDRAVEEVARRSGDVAARRIEELERSGERYEQSWKEELSKRIDLEREVANLRYEIRQMRETIA